MPRKRMGFLDHRKIPSERFDLHEVTEPKLYRNIYAYEEVCKIEFDHKDVLMDPPEEIFITDTTFRDGQQSRPPYTVTQIVDLFEMLHRLSGPNGVIRQSEFFLYSDRDRESVEKCLEMNFEYPEVTGWIRADKGDFDLVKEMGLRETGILTSVSDYHIFLKLKKDRKKAMSEYHKVVSLAMEKGVIPRCHFEDVTRADVYGFVVPFAQELMMLSEESGLPVKIRLCDTMGFGVTYPGASLPRSVPKIVRAMVDDAGVSPSQLEWHGHNDFHKVLVNATTAWLYGCAAANGALLGFGERTGNPPIEALVIEYISLIGAPNGIDTRVITEIRNYFEREIGVSIPPNLPFVGANFNTTSAGIHADGILKNEEIYNIFNTEKILNRPIGVSINDKSGLAGIAQWVNSHFALTGNERLDKDYPGIAKLNKWVNKQYQEGRTTAISEEEMERMARTYLPHIFVSEFDVLKARAREMSAHIFGDLLDNLFIKTLRPQQIEPTLQSAVDGYPFIQFAYVTDLEGKKITKNITQAVDKAKYEKVGLHEDYSNRPWFIEPLKDGKIHVTHLFSSIITGALCITVSGPIRNERGEIIGILGLDIRFEDVVKAEE
ncbi:MAG: histone-lysine N-methyltransferase [Syntrophobacterales bacterium]|nr:MAG: histone-lysine N-methyltransferase [Syntrophobacterales bacterium]